MDLTGIPADAAPWVAIPAALFVLWKLAGEGIKSWKDARQVGRVPPTPYEALAARVVALEQGALDSEKRHTEARDRDRDRITALETDLAAVRAVVRRLAGVLVREVAAVLAWIAGGARPPAPDAEIAIIRSVITDLERDQKEAP